MEAIGGPSGQEEEIDRAREYGAAPGHPLECPRDLRYRRALLRHGELVFGLVSGAGRAIAAFRCFRRLSNSVPWTPRSQRCSAVSGPYLSSRRTTSSRPASGTSNSTRAIPASR